MAWKRVYLPFYGGKIFLRVVTQPTAASMAAAAAQALCKCLVCRPCCRRWRLGAVHNRPRSRNPISPTRGLHKTVLSNVLCSLPLTPALYEGSPYGLVFLPFHAVVLHPETSGCNYLALSGTQKATSFGRASVGKNVESICSGVF